MGTSIPLTQVASGRKAVVRSISGGFGLVRRLDALGIREGKEIVKASSQIARGPVIIRFGNTEVAIGFGMAQKIFVELI